MINIYMSGIDKAPRRRGECSPASQGKEERVSGHTGQVPAAPSQVWSWTVAFVPPSTGVDFSSSWRLTGRRKRTGQSYE